MATVNGEGDEELDDDDDGPPTPISVVKVPTTPPLRPPSMRPAAPTPVEPTKPDE